MDECYKNHIKSDEEYAKKLFNDILSNAVKVNASDIHIEPFNDFFVVRTRVDGELREVYRFLIDLYPALATIIKLMAHMDITEKRLPQDGRVDIDVEGNLVDIRVSTIPTIYREKIVLRILDRNSFLKTKSDLGFSEGAIEKIDNIINKKSGILLVTGPTGSGKTTTVYSILNELQNISLGFSEGAIEKIDNIINKKSGILLVTGPTGSGKTTTVYSILNELQNISKNIMTIEDPVEYKMEGINQIQVNSKIGLTFEEGLRAILRQDPDIIIIGEIRDVETARIAIRAGINQIQVNSKIGLTFEEGLRAILRQDPDIIIIGEIRDVETARIAIRAAITGHLVISTMHTNDSISSIARLIDMQIPRYLINASIIGVISQRLVKKLCTYCSHDIIITDDCNNKINTKVAIGCDMIL